MYNYLSKTFNRLLIFVLVFIYKLILAQNTPPPNPRYGGGYKEQDVTQPGEFETSIDAYEWYLLVIGLLFIIFYCVKFYNKTKISHRLD